jgi:hypothetical protein
MISRVVQARWPQVCVMRRENNMGHYVRTSLAWICLCTNLVVGAAPLALPRRFQALISRFVRSSERWDWGWWGIEE